MTEENKVKLNRIKNLLENIFSKKINMNVIEATVVDGIVVPVEKDNVVEVDNSFKKK